MTKVNQKIWQSLLRMIAVLVIVIVIVPMSGMTAWATGTECENFAQFKAAMEDPDIETVTLMDLTETLPEENGDAAIVVQSTSGIKELIIGGSAAFIQETEESGYTNFITVGSGVTLNVSTGSESDGLSVNPSKSGGENSVFYLDGGELHFTEDFTGSISSDERFEGIYGAIIRVTSGNLVIENGNFHVFDTNVSADRGFINTTVEDEDQENTMVTLLGAYFSYMGNSSGDLYVLLNSCNNVFVDKITYITDGFTNGSTAQIPILDKKNYIAWDPFTTGNDPNFILADLNNPGYLSFKYLYSASYNNEMLRSFMKKIRLMEYSGNTWTEVYNWDPSSNAVKDFSVGSCGEAMVKTYKLVFDYEYEFGGNPTSFTYERELRAEWKDLSYSGSGTENDPVQVNAFEELRRALYDPNIEYVEVTNDIEYELDYLSYSSNPGYDVESKINDYRQGILSAEDLYEYLAELDVTDGFAGADEYLGNRELLCAALYSRGAKHLILTRNVILDVENSFPYKGDDTGFKYGLEFGNDLTISGGGAFSVKLTCPNFSKDAAAIYSSTGNHLVIEDATIKAETKQALGYAHAIYMLNGSIVIHDGEFYGQHLNNEAGYKAKFAIGAVYLGSGIGKSEIDGGTFSEVEAGQNYSWSIAGLMIHEDALSKVTLNGGTYETGLMKVGSELGSELSADDMRSILKTGATYTSRTKTINGLDLKRVVVTPSAIDFEEGVGDSPEHPAYCTSYAELKYALEHPTIQYIVVNGFTNTTGLDYYALDYKTDYEKDKCAIVIPQYSTKNLVIYADVNIRATHSTELLYSFIQNLGNLTISGTGSLNVSFNASGYPSAILFNQGTLTIEDDITLDPTSHSFANQFGYSIWHETGEMTIHGGTFNGYKSSAVLVNNGDGRIYGGTFKVLGAEYEFGLCMHTHRKASEVDFLLYGGTFQGIRASQVESGNTYLKLPSLLPYGAKYKEYLNNDWWTFNSEGKLETYTTLKVVPATEIESVTFSVVAPKDGEKAKFIASENEPGYYVNGTNGVEWMVSDTGTENSYDFMSDGDKFEAGKYYRVRVTVDHSSNHYFKADRDGETSLVEATINGQPASAYKSYPYDAREQIMVVLEFGQCNTAIIKNVAIVNLREPVAGESPTYTANTLGTGYYFEPGESVDRWTDRLYKRNGIVWYDGNGDIVYADDTFVAGKSYKVKIYLDADSAADYRFDWDIDLPDETTRVTGTINGKAAEVVPEGSNTMWNHYIEYTFTCQKKDVSILMISDLDAPQAGKIPDRTVTVAYPDLYTVEYIYWYDCENTPLFGEDTFMQGERYKVEIKVVPAKAGGMDASQFVTPVTAYINGEEVTERLNWDGVTANSKSAYILYTFFKGASAPEISGVTVSGDVTSFGSDEDDVTVQLIRQGEDTPSYQATVEGGSTLYSMSDVASGVYTLRVSKAKHVTRENEIVVSDADVVVDVKVCPIGDATGDGKVSTKDWNAVYKHISKTTLLKQYEFACGDVTGEGKVSTKDWNAIYKHINKTVPLW